MKILPQDLSCVGGKWGLRGKEGLELEDEN